MEAGTRRDHSFSLARKPLTTEMTARVDRFEFRGFAFTRGSSSSVFFFFFVPSFHVLLCGVFKRGWQYREKAGVSLG